MNQIALFEGKVAGGNGEQVLSRDVYRLGQLFDFFRMLSFYFTTVGYYVCTMVISQISFFPLYVCLFLLGDWVGEGGKARFVNYPHLLPVCLCLRITHYFRLVIIMSEAIGILLNADDSSYYIYFLIWKGIPGK